MYLIMIFGVKKVYNATCYVCYIERCQFSLDYIESFSHLTNKSISLDIIGVYNRWF